MVAQFFLVLKGYLIEVLPFLVCYGLLGMKFIAFMFFAVYLKCQKHADAPSCAAIKLAFPPKLLDGPCPSVYLAECRSHLTDIDVSS